MGRVSREAERNICYHKPRRRRDGAQLLALCERLLRSRARACELRVARPRALAAVEALGGLLAGGGPPQENLPRVTLKIWKK